MQLTMLKSKIHQAMVTGAYPDYPGSLTVDSELIEEAGLLPHEKILVANLENGERFETYVIPGIPGARQIELNGAAALKGKIGDRIIIISFVTMDAKEAESWVPKVLVLEGENQIVQPGLQELFASKRPVFLSTSSAWGVMEGAVRNVCSKRVLNCMCGAFSDKWFDVSKRCGKEATALRFDWGQPVCPELVREELASGAFDAITIVHNETSTGVMNPLANIMAVVRDFPEVISIVDTVSSFSALPIPMDELGIDVMLTGTQKALALPPGLALFSVSERAMKRAASVEGRGYYFDFIEFLKNHEKGMTPSTPVIPLIHALQSKLDDVAKEGLEARHARHRATNACTRRWMEEHGFRLFPDEEHASVTLCCIDNCRDLDVVTFNKALQSEKQFSINCGYGKLKGKTFRISNMGDETEDTMAELFAAMDDLLERFLPETVV